MTGELVRLLPGALTTTEGLDVKRRLTFFGSRTTAMRQTPGESCRMLIVTASALSEVTQCADDAYFLLENRRYLRRPL